VKLGMNASYMPVAVRAPAVELKMCGAPRRNSRVRESA
jgi:hypothetical protein